MVESASKKPLFASDQLVAEKIHKCAKPTAALSFNNKAAVYEVTGALQQGIKSLIHSCSALAYQNPDSSIHWYVKFLVSGNSSSVRATKDWYCFV